MLVRVPKLAEESGRVWPLAKQQQMLFSRFWSHRQCDTVMIGMCFDKTASNTGRMNWFACFLSKLSNATCCGHHMFKVNVSVSLGEFISWSKFMERWTEPNHHQVEQRKPPFIPVSESMNTFILQHSQKDFPRNNCDLASSLQYYLGCVLANQGCTLQTPFNASYNYCLYENLSESAARWKFFYSQIQVWRMAVSAQPDDGWVQSIFP